MPVTQPSSILPPPSSIQDESQQALDHDDFGMTQSKLMTVIDSKSVERGAGGKPVSTFLHPVLENSDRCFWMANHRTIENKKGRFRITKACFGTNAAAAYSRPIEPPKAPRVRAVPLLSSRRMYVAFESSAPKIGKTFFM
jgi:hypothetical protein